MIESAPRDQYKPRAATKKQIYFSLAVVFVYPLWWLVESTLTGSQSVRSEQIAFLIASVGWLLAIRYHASVSLRTIVLIAIALRVLLIPASVSDDLYRYIWEGRVRAAGHNPYVLPPESDELRDLRDPLYKQINHKYHAGIYPPIAQSVFVVAASISPTVLGFKLTLLGFDFLTLAVLVIALRAAGRDSRLVVVYALSPLVLMGIAREAHLDAIALFGLAVLLWGAVVAMRSARVVHLLAAGAGLGFAIGAKLFPIVLLPWAVQFAWCSNAESKRMRARNVAALLGGAVFVPLIVTLFYFSFDFEQLFSRDASGLGGVQHFATNYHVLDVGQQALRLFLSDEYASLVAIGFVGVGAIVCAIQRLPPAIAQLSLFAWLLLWMPTVHPWYVLWIMPALCFVSVPHPAPRSRSSQDTISSGAATGWGTPALLVLPVAIVLALEGNHLRETTGVWRMPGWAGPVIVATVVLFAIAKRITLKGDNAQQRTDLQNQE